MNPMIQLNHVTVKYNLGKDKVDSLKEYIVRLLKGNLFYDEFLGLDDVSLSVKKGEVFGLIGLNGAGKSTLLKVVAGVIKPSIGEVKVSGTVAPLIELGAGFDPELSAKENVFLNGAILGHDTKFIRERYDSIMDFAELKDFEDVPVKNFSSGMYAKLGFAIATEVNADVLIVDEILGVGDYRFQEKCHARIQELMSGNTTVLMVSHDLNAIRQYCTRVAWLEHGRIVEVGDTELLCEKYIGKTAIG